VPIDSTDLALFSAATTVTVRNGRKASFWHGSWINGQAPYSLCPLLYKHSRRKKRSVREATTNGRWIADIAHNLNHNLLDEFFKLWREIEAANLNLQDDEEDCIIWNLESSGQFSTRSAYAIQFAGHTLSSFPSLIWEVWAPPKCKFFLWLLLQDKLWTAARLQQRGWENNYFCALCIRNLETVQHLFFECPLARSVWNLVADWSLCEKLRPSGWEYQEDIEDWFAQTTTSGDKKGHTMSILTLWCLWNQRNAVIFRDQRKSAIGVFDEIKDTVHCWSLARRLAPEPPTVVHLGSE